MLEEGQRGEADVVVAMERRGGKFKKLILTE